MKDDQRTRASSGNGDAMESAARRPSLEETEDEIIAEFAGLADLTEKYEHLVRLGRELRAPDGVRAPEHSVTGCQSRVWIRTEMVEGRLRIAADSDAMIVRGLIALLLRILDGRAPAEIAVAELRTFDATGLRTHLSPLRSNGLAAMVRRIREDAAAETGRS
jgi:cysteine desulfuration protein SufE